MGSGYPFFVMPFYSGGSLQNGRAQFNTLSHYSIYSPISATEWLMSTARMSFIEISSPLTFFSTLAVQSWEISASAFVSTLSH